MLLSNGCIVLDEDAVERTGHTSRGVNLSDAMHASAGGGGSLPDHGSHSDSGSSLTVDPSPLFAVAGAIIGGVASGVASADSGYEYNYRWTVPMDVSFVVPLNNGQFDSLTRLTLTPVAFEGRHWSASFFLRGDIVELVPNSLPDAAIDHVWMFETGFAFRYYFTPPRTFVSPYLTADVSCHLLSWDYRNPIFVGTDVITDDNLAGVGGYVGLGIAIKRNSRMSLFGEVGYGGMTFGGETGEGFHNDVFGDFGYFSVKAGVTWQF